MPIPPKVEVMPKQNDTAHRTMPLVPYLAPPRRSDRIPLPYAALIAFAAFYLALVLIEAAAR